MNAAILGKLFGHDQAWRGPCTVVLDAEASVQTSGTDAIVGGGAKSYAPRLVSGRITADAVCFLPPTALVLMQQQKTRGASGEERVHQALIVADAEHVVAVEFADTQALASLGLQLPAAR